MHQPQGFIDSSKPDYVCKLHKYRLKKHRRRGTRSLVALLYNMVFFTHHMTHQCLLDLLMDMFLFS